MSFSQAISFLLSFHLQNSHLDYLKDMVSKINPIHINKLVVEYSKSQDFNVGMLKGDVVTIGFDNKTEIDEIKAQCADIFYAIWQKAKNNKKYQTMLDAHKTAPEK